MQFTLVAFIRALPIFLYHLCPQNVCLSECMITNVALESKSDYKTRPCTTVRDSEDILEQSSFQKYITCWVFLALCHMMHLSICVIMYLYFCICVFGTWECNFWYPWTILFSKICHMLGLLGTLSYAVFLYLCICIFVFACLTHGNIIFDTLEHSSFQKYITCWVFLALCHMLY